MGSCARALSRVPYPAGRQDPLPAAPARSISRPDLGSWKEQHGAPFGLSDEPARCSNTGKQFGPPPGSLPSPHRCAAAGSENVIKIVSCYLSIINDQNKFTALCLITLPDFHLNIWKEMAPWSMSLSDECKGCICGGRGSPEEPSPTFNGKVLFSCCRTELQQREEKQLGTAEISSESVMCSCLDAARAPPSPAPCQVSAADNRCHRGSPAPLASITTRVDAEQDGCGHIPPPARGQSPQPLCPALGHTGPSPLRGDPSQGSRAPPTTQPRARSQAPARADERVSGTVACVLFCLLNKSKQTVSLPLLSDVVKLFSPKLPKYEVST